ncbi:MAG: hypothetical protein R6U96_18170 [Promethearchaeia archaeon]
MIKWSDIVGGTVYMKYPEDLEIPENVVQQIQISHDFIESNITIKEENWNSLSYSNENKEIVSVLVLDRFDEASDYKSILEEFSNELDMDLTEEELEERLEKFFKSSLNAFRARDEVISKLSNELADLKNFEYEINKKIEFLTSKKFLDVKTKIMLLLLIHEELSFDHIKARIETSERWLTKVIKKLERMDLIDSHKRKDEDKKYYLTF